MTDQREAFEAWASQQMENFQMTRYADDIPQLWCGSYYDARLEIAWQAWLAAIEHERITQSMSSKSMQAKHNDGSLPPIHESGPIYPGM